ncbi:MAG: SUMF1/EgtB/PvdO family nonheme iron enzyme [Candidatus Poribacteria bacterium]|nr:SUMF1/EgtB/PvdO family nonheme iron enzyme [Candidatus Poribacteria bacterium]
MQQQIFQDKTFTNSIGMQFVRIESGTFKMGSANANLADEVTADKEYLRDGDWDEQPIHQVTLSTPFYIGIYQVTNEQYEQFQSSHNQLRGKLGFSQDDDEAVVFVDWHDATNFCKWLSEKEGLPYRLPTEAEWEYACRAGTTTHFHTGDTLPEEFQKNVCESWYPDEGRSRGVEEVVPLHVGKTEPNTWGLYDMHGNVEEWCQDWYGPYDPQPQTDPCGRETGLYRVTRGGSHSTLLCYLRSANRIGAVPEDKHWYIGFRVVCGEIPDTTTYLPAPKTAMWSRDVNQESVVSTSQESAYFADPIPFVRIPEGSNGPLFSRHNHVPAIVECPNGDMFSAWYSCVTERGRELTVAASRLRYEHTEWDPAEPFWGPPDRNNHATSLWCNEDGRIYHFNGLSAAATWGPLALVLRYSDDNGATWSKPRFISPEHQLRHMPIASVFRRQDGSILLACDAVSGGNGGTAIWLSEDDGETWYDPGAGQPIPEFTAGKSGGWIAGIHAAVVELSDGRLMAYGRGDTIDGRMPKSVSDDGGKSWQYSASPFPPVSGGQRCVFQRLQEGPILLVSFTGSRKTPETMPIIDASGKERLVTGIFSALSYDDGESWTHIHLISDDGPDREIETMDGRPFIMGLNSAEPGGYLAVCQGRNGIIHLISSKQHYRFNYAWLKETPPSLPL